MNFAGRRGILKAGIALTGLAVLATAGCATQAQVSGRSAIATARYAIRDAEDRGAERFAPDEVQTARQKVFQAMRSANEGLAVTAQRLAEQATVDAQLASAISGRDAAREQLAEARRVGRDADALRTRTTDAAEERIR